MRDGRIADLRFAARDAGDLDRTCALRRMAPTALSSHE
jgi:hypothetical protein